MLLCWSPNIQLWTAMTRDMAFSKLDVVNILTTSISITYHTDMLANTRARFLQLYSFLCLL